MGKVLSFGELLLRICPDGDGEWLATNKLPFYVGGAELNVATALALWNIPSAYFTALPVNFMADQLIGYLNNCKIDTASIYHGGDRIGLYYLPKGKDLKNAGVIYDRANSAFSALKTNTIDWDKVLEDVEWFHFSAICPALSQDAADVCLEAVKAASERGITVSVDLNYRAKLWQYGKQPVEVIPQLAKYCDLIMGNIWAAEKMLGISLAAFANETEDKNIYLEQAKITSAEICEQYPKCKWVANTFRFDYQQGIKYYTTLYTDNELLVSKEYCSEHILDKVGSGDCFMAGLIYGFYQQLNPLTTLNFATAAAFNKLFIPSDCTTATIADVQKTLAAHD
ncbi:sugar kinase [Pedobacter insulae]|uniref:2-dehydro-3-deoxygluconokinase n=1 Tax=Pedobacter insulae TaxID=414048 RepID=A0A1I2ZYP3_9SPHI|nr:sugar kinase [Pedobacter insulae]SFH42785.1 2-dehydro-3-deoxygluconokinase [Pedobacter insulae]